MCVDRSTRAVNRFEVAIKHVFDSALLSVRKYLKLNEIANIFYFEFFHYQVAKTSHGKCCLSVLVFHDMKYLRCEMLWDCTLHVFNCIFLPRYTEFESVVERLRALFLNHSIISPL